LRSLGHLIQPLQHRLDVIRLRCGAFDAAHLLPAALPIGPTQDFRRMGIDFQGVCQLRASAPYSLGLGLGEEIIE
jgi:hypothetical protein